MQNRLIRATLELGRHNASQSAAYAHVLRDTASGFFTTARHALMVVGMLALAAAGAFLFQPQLGEHVLARVIPVEEKTGMEDVPPLAAALVPLPAANAKPEATHATMVKTGAGTSAAADDVHRQQQRVAAWIARRYRVASDATDMFVTTAYQTARELKLDPLLILSVMAIESRFNPFAESPAGAQGLMQVMSKIHKDKFEPLGGLEAALHPVANIKVGSRILKEYVTRGGSVEAGLKMYVGAALLETDFGYGSKVLAEYARLKDVAMGRKVSIYTTTAAAPKPAPKEVAVPPQVSDAFPTEANQPLAHAEQLASAL